MGNDMGATAEALRLAMLPEERLKMEMGNMKNMESMLGSAGMTKMLQMMENDAKNFGPMGLPYQGGFESGPASSSGSVPQSPKNAPHEQSPGYSPGSSQAHPAGESGMQQNSQQATFSNHSTNHQSQQIRRDVELTKVTGGEANLQYQREIGSNRALPPQYHKDEDEEDEDDDDESMNDAVAVYPKDMSAENQMGCRKEMPMEVPMVYPESPMTGAVGHPHIQSSMTGSE